MLVSLLTSVASCFTNVSPPCALCVWLFACISFLSGEELVSVKVPKVCASHPKNVHQGGDNRLYSALLLH